MDLVLGSRIALMFATAGVAAAMLTLLARGDLLARGVPALAVQALAVAQMVWARAAIRVRDLGAGRAADEPAWSAGGPYRYLRHPIYAALLWIVWAGVLTHVSPLSASVGAVATLAIAVRIAAAERLAARRHPGYPLRVARTPRVIPWVL